MIEIRIHGRGGQGAVIASLIFARAAHFEGWKVQVFPEFGVERRGVPVTAFARLDRNPIYLRTKVYKPDHIIVLDPALIQFVDVTAGLQKGGTVLINSTKRPSDFSFSDTFRVASVDATNIAAKHRIGTSTAPIVNTTMVGAFSSATSLVSFAAISRAIAEMIPGAAAQDNVNAAREAFENTNISMGVLQEAFSRMDHACHREVV